MGNYRTIYKILFKQTSCSKKIIPTVPKKEIFIVLPYLGTLSSNLKQKLKTRFKYSLPQCNIKIILKSTNSLSSLFCFKDVIPEELQSHLVYNFHVVTGVLLATAKLSAILM